MVTPISAATTTNIPPDSAEAFLPRNALAEIYTTWQCPAEYEGQPIIDCFYRSMNQTLKDNIFPISKGCLKSATPIRSNKVEPLTVSSVRITCAVWSAFKALGLQLSVPTVKILKKFSEILEKPHLLEAQFETEIAPLLSDVKDEILDIRWDVNNAFIYPEMRRPTHQEVHSADQNMWRRYTSGKAITDLSIQIEDESIPVNSDQLATNSIFFKNFLGLKAANNDENKTISLQKIIADSKILLTADQFRLYNEYTYTKQFRFHEIKLHDLLALINFTRYIEDEAAFKLCSSDLKYHLCRDTFWPILEVATKYDLKELYPLFALTVKERARGIFRRLLKCCTSIVDFAQARQQLAKIEVNSLDPYIYDKMRETITLSNVEDALKMAYNDPEIKNICRDFIENNLEQFNKEASRATKELYAHLMLGIQFTTPSEKV